MPSLLAAPALLPLTYYKPLIHTSVTITGIDDASSFGSGTASVQEISRAPSPSVDFNNEIENFRVSFEILNVLERFGKHLTAPGSEDIVWPGKHKFLSHVYHYVREQQPIQLTMPAFPCKSLNRANKVLGCLPDFGEELALGHLHAMGKEVGQVYKPGAEINIASDGVLFNDILGISDEDCWDYGEALKTMILEHNFHTVRFTRCLSLLGLMSEALTTKEAYLASTAKCREELERRFSPSEDALTDLIKKDKDTTLTYCGMVKFLESETEISASLMGQSRTARIRIQKHLAKKMMQRSEAFTLAIRTLKPHQVRLSMHPSSGATKLSIPLVPTLDGGFQKSPWHSCVAVGVDGGYHMVHQNEVRQTHVIVREWGRPYFFREKGA